MKIFDTQAALAAASLAVGQLVRTKGNVSPDDNQGYLWRIGATGTGITLANGNVAVAQTNDKAGRVNLLDNGNFSLWSRGNGPFSDGFGPDGWFTLGGNRLSELDTDTPPSSEVSQKSQFSVLVTGQGGKTPQIRSTISLSSKGEQGIFLPNKVFTFSFYVKSSIAANIIVSAIFQNDVSGGDMVTYVQNTTPLAIGLDWQKIELNVVAESAIPNSENAALVFYIFTDVVDSTFKLSQVQFEEGPVATEFEYRDTELERLLTGYPDDTNTVTGQETALQYARAGRRNILINGQLSVWQRGVSFALTSAAYLADRFLGGSARQYDQSTDVPTNAEIKPQFSIQCDGLASSPNLLTGVELPAAGEPGVFSQNKLFTLSFWIKDAGSGNDLNLRLRFQDASTGGNPIDIVSTSTIAVTAGGWEKIVYTFSIGSAVPNPTNKQLEIFIQVSNAGSVFNATLFQLEEGPVATTFDYRSPQEVLADCHRYYQKTYNSDVVPGTVTRNGAHHVTPSVASGQSGFGVRFPQTMRTTPTITLYSTFTGAAGVIRNASNSTDLATSAQTIGENGFGSIADAGIIAANIYRYHYTADADL